MFLSKRFAFLFLFFIYALTLLVSCSERGNGNTGIGSVSPPDLEGITPSAVKFSEITYTRPDTVSLYSELSSAILLVRNGGPDSSRIIEAVRSAERAYSSYLTMYSYSRIMCSKDENDAFYSNEYSFLSKAYADVFSAKERLAYEIVRSEHKNELAKIGFSDSAIFKIPDPSIISDDYFSLITQEGKLKHSFTMLSENNVYITYDGVTDTYSGTLDRLRETHGDGTQRFLQASAECAELYSQALLNRKLDIYIALISTRGLIADTLGYDSYNDCARDLLGYTHTLDDYQKYAEDVFEYLLPVYKDLSIKIFNPYFNNNIPKFLDKNTLITNMLSLYKSIDNELYESFASMVSSELYDIVPGAATTNRFSYTAYFNSKRTPFLFIASFNDARDYLNVSFGFGKYIDVLLNESLSASPLDADLTARLLGVITLSSITDSLDTDESKYIYYFSMKSIMSGIIQDTFLSLLEHEIYEMDPAELSRDSITAMMRKIANQCSVHNPKIVDVVSDDLVLNPKTLQSKAVSTFYAAEAFFDKGDLSSKLQIYKSILERTTDKTSESVLSSFGISSPFDDEAVMELSDKIFYSINGYHYYRNDPAEIPVA